MADSFLRPGSVGGTADRQRWAIGGSGLRTGEESYRVTLWGVQVATMQQLPRMRTIAIAERSVVCLVLVLCVLRTDSSIVYLHYSTLQSSTVYYSYIRCSSEGHGSWDYDSVVVQQAVKLALCTRQHYCTQIYLL